MSTLDDFIESARRNWDAPTKLSTDVIIRDIFDESSFRLSLEEAPELQGLISETSEKHDYVKGLYQDVYNLFYKAYPRIREPHELEPTRLVNHAIVTDVSLSPDVERLFELTNNDRYCSTMATISLGQQIKDKLNKITDEAMEKADAAQEAQGVAGDARGELLSASGDQCDDGTLQIIADTASEAQGAADVATEEAQQAAERLGQAMRQDVRKTVQGIEEALASQLDVMAVWGVSPANLQRMSFQERYNLAKRLTSGKLGQFYKQLGRFKMQASADRARKVDYARDEVVGTRLSGDLQDVLTSELVMSRHPVLRLDFLQRFMEGQLLSKKYQGIERQGRGAVIVMLDSSGSMAGQRELWSKSFAMALIDQARATNRDAVVMNFSHDAADLHVYRFPKGKVDIDLLIEFAEEFLAGGTNFEVPIDKAIEILEEEFNDSGRSKGDLLMVTDDECGVTAKWLEKYHIEKKRLGFRTYGITVGKTMISSALASFCDDVRAISDCIDTGQMSDVFRNLG
jgi:uncharacterized protein with von Willebrand factor type A (vWA) domain